MNVVSGILNMNRDFCESIVKLNRLFDESSMAFVDGLILKLRS